MNPLLLLALVGVQLANDIPPGSGPGPGPGAMKEEVVVTAERGPETRADVPAAVSVLPRDQIARLPAETLAELLRFLPGFQMFFASESAGIAPMVTARGFFGGGEAEYVQLRVDGVPVGDPESGLADWRRIRAADVERIEALRGPASSLYGDAALGGVVEVFTSPPAGASPGASGSVSGGSFGGFSADALGRFDVAGAAASAGGSYARTDGERSHAAGERGGVEASASGAAGSGVWRIAFAGTALDRDDPGALDAATARSDPAASDPAYRFDGETTHRGRLAAEWSRQDGPLPLRVVVSGALRGSDILRTLPLAPGLYDRALRELDTSTASIAADGDRSFHLFGRDARLRFGVEAGRDGLDGRYRSMDDDGHSGEIVATSNGRRLRASAFLLQDWRPWTRVRITAGLHWDRIADDFTGTTSGDATHEAWSPRVGVSVRLGATGATSVFAQYSRAFQAPTLDQLFDARPFPDFAGGTFTVSNPALEPQRAETVEAGGSGAWGALGWEAAVYRIAVDD
ncbi:MAG TPA: TonB-dependent receptor, partial [Thermoanaerobaculia bacterium]|nr:TonB-dependent receptor [Thermoanaerobaculia bacterium]